MNEKKRFNKRTIKINLLFTCIFLILIGTFIIGKCFTKGDVKAEPVNKVATTAINGALQNNNEKNPQQNIPDNNQEKPIQDNSNENQIEESKQDNLSEKQTNQISNELAKQSNTSEEGEKYVYDAAKVSDIAAYKEKNDGKKIAFLTFDDGPSTTVTPKILDILKQYNVKATFFLIGENIDSNEKSKELVKREFNEGHAIGNHTYSHNRGNKLFPNRKVNVPVFMEDVEKTDKALKNVLGQDFNTRILRLPGGYMSRTYYKDPNLPELNAALKEKNKVSIDWNAESKDAEGKPNKSAAELFNILKEQIGTKEKVVILMHDTYGKMETANALPQVIEYLKGQGYEFKIIK